MTPTLVEYLTKALESFDAGPSTYAVTCVRSQPRRSHALFPHASTSKLVKPYQEELLCVLSQHRDSTRGNHDEPVPVCAIEAHLYTIPATSTLILYVSKVDSTGLGPRSTSSPTRLFVSSFLAYHLVHLPHDAVRLRVHLFAKAEPQYLFPGSADNKATKRVLDDKGLIRWWKRTIEVAIRDNRDVRDAFAVVGASKSIKPFYVVPGLEYLESLPYVPDRPPSSTTNSTSPPPRWTYGHAYASLPSPLHPVPDSQASFEAAVAAPLPDHVPAFPDDPKSRFLHSLTSSCLAVSGSEGDYDDLFDTLHSTLLSSNSSGHSTTLKQRLNEVEHERERERARLIQGVEGGVAEWCERLGFRQECCSGQLVGFFVVAIEPGLRLAIPPAASDPNERVAAEGEPHPPVQPSNVPLDPSPSPNRPQRTDSNDSTSTTDPSRPPSTECTSSSSNPTSTRPHDPSHTTHPPPPPFPLSLPHASFTKLWTKFHNQDYSLEDLERRESERSTRTQPLGPIDPAASIASSSTAPGPSARGGGGGGGGLVEALSRWNRDLRTLVRLEGARTTTMRKTRRVRDGREPEPATPMAGDPPSVLETGHAQEQEEDPERDLVEGDDGFERHVQRKGIKVDNPHLRIARMTAAAGVEGSNAPGGGGAGGIKRDSAGTEVKVVNVLAPRKKKKKE
ncbi:hypothetical protein JCM10212_000084 [Sporobolomyces blumeae]